MNVVKYILMAVYAVVCVALIALVLKQNKEDGKIKNVIVIKVNMFYNGI